MYSLLLCFVVIVLWYMRFRYKRRRLYQLAEKIPEFKDFAVPVVGYLKYSFDAENLTIPFIETLSRFSYSVGGVAKIWAGPMLCIGLTNNKDTEFTLKNCLEKHQFFTRSLKCITGNGGIYAPVSMWSQRRKLLVPAFSPKRINSFVDILITRGEELADSLDQMVDNDKFNVWPYINKYTLVSVSETSLGVKIDEINQPGVNILVTIDELIKLVSYRIMHFWLWPDFIFKCSAQFNSLTKHKTIINNLINEIITRRRGNLRDVDVENYANKTFFVQHDDKVKSFLDHLIVSSGLKNGFNDVELQEEISTFLIAGTDTSAVAISNTLLLLSKYPKVQDKLYEELKNYFGNSERKLNKDDLNNLKYLDAVLKESLRILPPVPIIFRTSVEEIQLPSGVIVPADTCIIVSILGVNRDPNHWGPDADCFKPERFLTGEDTGLYIPFSLGPRNCIGYQYAMITSKIALVSILRRFAVVGEEEASSKPNIKCNFSIMMKVADGYNIQLKRR